MPIEIRQLTIKSNVLQQDATGKTIAIPAPDLEELKDLLRVECKQMILDLLQKERER